MPYNYSKVKPEIINECGMRDVAKTLDFIAKSPNGLSTVGDIIYRKDCVGDSWKALACIEYLEEIGLVTITRNEDWTADGVVIWKGRK